LYLARDLISSKHAKKNFSSNQLCEGVRPSEICRFGEENYRALTALAQAAGGRP